RRDYRGGYNPTPLLRPDYLKKTRAESEEIIRRGDCSLRCGRPLSAGGGPLFSSRRRHTRWTGGWSSDVCSSDLLFVDVVLRKVAGQTGKHVDVGFAHCL